MSNVVTNANLRNFSDIQASGWAYSVAVSIIQNLYPKSELREA